MSGKLSTKDIKVGGEGVAKTLEPGNQQCKINTVSLEEFKFKEGSYNVILHLEGPDMGTEFEGFYLDKDQPELGRHAGKVGTVKLTEWAFADGTTKSGIEVSRDQEMLKALKQFCIQTNCMDWLNKQENKHDTIESFYKAFAKDKPFKGKFYNFCIGGKEYTNKGGYTSYDLFLPKYSKEGAPVESLEAEPSKLLKFKPEEHVKKKKVETVSEFGDAPSATDVMGTPSSDIISTPSTDFDL
jgi:hypothetical protein